MTYKDRYNEYLDECYGEVSVAGLKYDTSRLLEEIDPTAYRCGFNDWLDTVECDKCGSSADINNVDEDTEYKPKCEDCLKEEEAEDDK